jgi:Beta-lactamase enzyme family
VAGPRITRACRAAGLTGGLLIAVVIAAAPAAPASPAARAGVWHPHIRAAKAYARSRAGLVAFAVRTPTRSWGFRSQVVIPSASVIKALLLVTYLNRPSVRHRRLGRGDTGILSPMIRVSDNGAASAVRNRVGNAAIMAMARRAGMPKFVVAPAWGLSHIDAADESRLFLHLPELVPARHRAYALRLLASVVSFQRWGFGQARPPGWHLYFKGGWGVRGVNSQVALLRRGRLRVAVAILTRYDGGQAHGEATLRGLARRLLAGLGGRVRGDEDVVIANPGFVPPGG